MRTNSTVGFLVPSVQTLLLNNTALGTSQLPASNILSPSVSSAKSLKTATSSGSEKLLTPTTYSRGSTSTISTSVRAVNSQTTLSSKGEGPKSYSMPIYWASTSSISNTASKTPSFPFSAAPSKVNSPRSVKSLPSLE